MFVSVLSLNELVNKLNIVIEIFQLLLKVMTKYSFQNVPLGPDCDGEIVGFYCFELISKRENWKTAKKICSEEGGRRGFLAEVYTIIVAKKFKIRMHHPN